MKRLTLGVLVLLSSTLSLLLLVASANTCRFVLVAAVPDAVVEVIDTSATRGQELTQTLFDTFCDGHLVDLEGDIVWLLCKIFHVCAIALGALAAFLGVMINVVAPRTRSLCWQTLSICSALCALISVPVFLLFESKPCTDFPQQQSCSFALASFIHIAAIVFAIVTTICTQLFDPPTIGTNADRKKDLYSPAGKKKLDSGRYWFPLQSEHEDVEHDEENRMINDLLEKGALVTRSTAEDDEDEDPAAQSDDGVIGGVAYINQDEKLGRALPLDLSYEKAAREHDPTEDCESSDITLLGDEAVGIDLRGPVAVYEGLEREAPPYVEPSPTDEGLSPVVSEPRELDFARMPSLIDRADYDDDDEDSEKPVEEPVEDLGSLEPTVITISGAESVLDRADSPTQHKPDELSKDTPTTTTQDEVSGETKADMPKQRKTLQLDISRLMGPRRRNGYRLMDDTDLDSSLPMSPPLEIVTMNMINTSLEYDDFEDLYENGNKGLDEQLHQPGLQQQIRIEAPQDDDEMDPELLWNDDDDFVGIVSWLSNRSYEVCDVDNPGQFGPPVDARPSFSLKRRRNRRWNAGRSLASANSLLSYTIAEETASDLIDTDEDDTQNTFDPYGAANLDPIPLTKSRSAPNLARFDRPIKKDGWVVEDLQLTGVNTYKKQAQVFSVVESSSVVSARRSTGGINKKNAPQVETAIKASSSSSLPDLLRTEGKRLSTFREEKVFREGIHATTNNISDASNVDEDLRSSPLQETVKAKDARNARIRRLQNSSSPIRSRPEPQVSIKAATTIPFKLSRPPRPPPAPAVVSPYSSPSSKALPQYVVSSPESLERSSGDDSYETSFDSSYTLSMMDATLAELIRDRDPDEMSV